jgi:hypothetical protein
VHPGDLVVGFGQRVEGDQHDHRGGAHGPGGVTGAGASPTLCHQDPEPGAASGDVVRRELGDVVIVGWTSLGFDHGEQTVARIIDTDVRELARDVELVDDAVAWPRLCNAELVARHVSNEDGEDFVQRR